MNADIGATVPTGPTRDHNSYIGGSTIAALVGASPYSTALDVWARLTGRVEAFAGNDATELGDHLERPVLDLYARRRGVKSLLYPGTISHPSLAHIAATPDAVVDGRRTAQVKVVGVRQAARWGTPEQDGADGVPVEVLCQVSYEAALARLALGLPGDVADVVALIGTDLRVFEVPIDAGFGDDLIAIADDFWRKHVAANVIPDVLESRSADVLRGIYPRVRPGAAVRPVTPEIEALAREYDAARTAESAATKAKEAAGVKLCALIGDGAGFSSPERGIKALWPERDGRVNWERVAAHYRDRLVRAGIPGHELNAIELQNTSKRTRQIDVRVRKA